jgi:hypothetical protein
MDALTLAEFDELVARATDNMVAALEEFNQGQANPEAALYPAKAFRREFAEYFRKLLSAKFELGLQVAESSEASTERLVRR